MNLFETKKPLRMRLTEYPGEGYPVSSIVNIGTGICVFDLGWVGNDSGHTIHIIEGKVKGEGPWTVDVFTIEEITDPGELELYQQNKAREEEAGITDSLKEEIAFEELDRMKE